MPFPDLGSLHHRCCSLSLSLSFLPFFLPTSILPPVSSSVLNAGVGRTLFKSFQAWHSQTPQVSAHWASVQSM